MLLSGHFERMFRSRCPPRDRIAGPAGMLPPVILSTIKGVGDHGENPNGHGHHKGYSSILLGRTIVRSVQTVEPTTLRSVAENDRQATKPLSLRRILTGSLEASKVGLTGLIHHTVQVPNTFGPTSAPPNSVQIGGVSARHKKSSQVVVEKSADVEGAAESRREQIGESIALTVGPTDLRTVNPETAEDGTAGTATCP